jgi:branched-chain amino acid aminotransferase
MAPNFAFFNQRIVPYSEAKIGLLTHTLNYGTGVFGGIRAYWNEDEQQLFMFRPVDHFRRFLQSAKLLFMECPLSADDLTQALIKLLLAENYREDCYVRPFAYFSNETIGSYIAMPSPGISIVAIPFPPDTQIRNGLHVTISSWRRIDDNMLPARGKIAGAYVNSFLARTEAVQAGFDDALLLNADGHIAEGSTMNFFLVRGNVVCTPPVTDNILEGITRRTVLSLLRDDFNVAVEERSIDRSEIYLAEEAFFCGTSTQIAPVTRVDHRPIGTGRIGVITATLRTLYLSIVQGRVNKYLDWCMAVYSPADMAQNATQPMRPG